MASLLGFIKRNYTVFNPPVAPKTNEVLRFGILGAANIAPSGIIIPALSHPEVIVAAVAARDRRKAESYAKKHNIPIVHETYDDLIADPAIDCIYNPLPNGLHYEWTLKALKAGKHVLLEKPSVSNATEAKSLFQHPLLRQPDAPVLLEAFHYRFHPSWQYFLTLFDKGEVEHVEVVNKLFGGVFPFTDIRFNYSLSGGTLMDFGAYAVNSTRQVFGAEPTAVMSATYRPLPEGFDIHVDQAVYASYKFANGGTADISADLQARGGYWLPAVTKNWPDFRGALPTLTVTLKPSGENVKNGHQTTTKRILVFHNYIGPFIWHRIDNVTITEMKDLQGNVVQVDKKTEKMKMYKPTTAEQKGEDYWATYRYQLEAFVDRVKKRRTETWVDSDDSIRQMEMIDATYQKLGLPLRPTSKALEAEGQ